MALRVDFSIAARNLLRHGRRTLLLGLAMAAVTGLMVLLQGLSTGTRETMFKTATTVSTGHLNVGGFFKATPGMAYPAIANAAQVLEVVKRSVPEMTFAVMRGRGWAKVISESGSMQAGINGIDIKNEPAFKQILKITSGNIDDLAQPNTILVFEAQLKKLDVKVGDAVTISAPTTRGANNTVDVRVVAIAQDLGLLSGWSMFVPNETLRALSQVRSDAAGVIQIHVPDKLLPRIGEIGGRLRNDLEKAGYRVMDPDPRAFWFKFEVVNREEWTGQKLDVTTWEDELSFMSWTLQLLGGLSAVLLIILIAIVITGIMNTLWIAIRERTREIGALRAIGMQRGAVMRMFLFESLLLGLVGATTGALAGAGIAALVNASAIKVPVGMQLFLMSDRLRMAVHAPAMIGSIIMITVISAFAAIYPSFRAARLRPIEAMSHFG